MRLTDNYGVQRAFMFFEGISVPQFISVRIARKRSLKTVRPRVLTLAELIKQYQ